MLTLNERQNKKFKMEKKPAFETWEPFSRGCEAEKKLAGY